MCSKLSTSDFSIWFVNYHRNEKWETDLSIEWHDNDMDRAAAIESTIGLDILQKHIIFNYLSRRVCLDKF